MGSHRLNKISNTRKGVIRIAVFLIISAFLLAIAYESAYAQVFQITVPMSGAEEVPPVATAGTGLGTLTVNTATGSISGTVGFSGLTTPTTAGHIHIGAAGINGPVIVPMIGGLGVTAGTMLIPGAVLLPDQLAALTADGLYVNIHTTANLGGEIRGQIRFSTAAATGSIDQISLMQVVSGNFDPMRQGDELAGLSSDGRIFVSLDLATWIEIPGGFLKLIKGDFNGDGVDDLGGISAKDGAFRFTTDFGQSWTDVPQPQEWSEE